MKTSARFKLVSTINVIFQAREDVECSRVAARILSKSRLIVKNTSRRAADLLSAFAHPQRRLNPTCRQATLPHSLQGAIGTLG